MQTKPIQKRRFKVFSEDDFFLPPLLQPATKQSIF